MTEEDKKFKTEGRPIHESPSLDDPDDLGNIDKTIETINEDLQELQEQEKFQKQREFQKQEELPERSGFQEQQEQANFSSVNIREKMPVKSKKPPSKNLPQATDKISQKATQKTTGAIKEQLSKITIKATRAVISKAVKAALAAIASAVGPWGAVIIIVVILIILTAVPAFGIIKKARRGDWGASASQYGSVASSEFVGDISHILGNSTIVNNHGNPKSWYYGQGDDGWGDVRSFSGSGGWTGENPNFRNKGCALTSAAMLIRYYGIDSVTPLEFGKYNSDKHHSMLLYVHSGANSITEYLKEKGNINKKTIGVAKNIESIKAEIRAGNPMLTKIAGVWGADGQHWVLIIGLSKNEQKLVISDPSAYKDDYGNPRGAPARYVDINALTNGGVKAIFAFHDK